MITRDQIHSLSRIDQVLYRAAFDFAIEYCGATDEQAHLEGLAKVDRVRHTDYSSDVDIAHESQEVNKF